MEDINALIQSIREVIDPSGLPGSIKANSHRDLLIQLSTAQKWSGFIIQSIGIQPTTFTPGLFSWNSNALNKSDEDFDVYVGKGSSFDIAASIMTQGSILQYRDVNGYDSTLQVSSIESLETSWRITVIGSPLNSTHEYGSSSVVEHATLTIYNTRYDDQEISSRIDQIEGLISNINLDGNHENIDRGNAVEGVEPSDIEVQNPIKGDSAAINLSSQKVEHWTYSGTEWVLRFLIDYGNVAITPQDESNLPLVNSYEEIIPEITTTTSYVYKNTSPESIGDPSEIIFSLLNNTDNPDNSIYSVGDVIDVTLNNPSPITVKGTILALSQDSFTFDYPLKNEDGSDYGSYSPVTYPYGLNDEISISFNSIVNGNPITTQKEFNEIIAARTLNPQQQDESNLPLVNDYLEELTESGLTETLIDTNTRVFLENGQEYVEFTTLSGQEVIDLVNRPTESQVIGRFVNPNTGEEGFVPLIMNNPNNNTLLIDSFSYASSYSGYSYSSSGFFWNTREAAERQDPSSSTMVSITTTFPIDGSIDLELYLQVSSQIRYQEDFNKNILEKLKTDHTYRGEQGVVIENGVSKLGGDVSEFLTINMTDLSSELLFISTLNNSNYFRIGEKTHLSQKDDGGNFRSGFFHIPSLLTLTVQNFINNTFTTFTIKGEGAFVNSTIEEIEDSTDGTIIVHKDWVENKLASIGSTTYIGESGITVDGSNIKLGGKLTESALIDLDSANGFNEVVFKDDVATEAVVVINRFGFSVLDASFLNLITNKSFANISINANGANSNILLNATNNIVLTSNSLDQSSQVLNSNSGGLILNTVDPDDTSGDRINILSITSNQKPFKYNEDPIITYDNDIPNKKYIDDSLDTPSSAIFSISDGNGRTATVHANKVGYQVHLDIIDINTTVATNVSSSPIGSTAIDDINDIALVSAFSQEFTSYIVDEDGEKQTLVLLNVGNTLRISVLNKRSGTTILASGRSSISYLSSNNTQLGI